VDRVSGECRPVLVSVIYLVLLITLGIVCLRKGHWVMFIIGIVFPSLLADRRRDPCQAYG
jgi:hypothetical protein